MRVLSAALCLMMVMNSSVLGMKRFFCCGCKQSVCEQVVENNDCIDDSDSAISSDVSNAPQAANDNELHDVDPLKHIINKIAEYRENKIFLMHKNPDLNEQQYLYDTYGISVPQGARCIGVVS